MYDRALRICLLGCTLLLPAVGTEAAAPVSSFPVLTAQASGTAAKKPPKDGNEGTYPTYKGSKKQSASTSAKSAKPLQPPKDGNEGTYPTYKGSKKQSASSSAPKSAKPAQLPKDGNEGTYPTHKDAKKQSASSSASKSAKPSPSPKDGNGAAYPKYKDAGKPGASSTQVAAPAPLSPESGEESPSARESGNGSPEGAGDGAAVWRAEESSPEAEGWGGSVGSGEAEGGQSFGENGASPQAEENPESLITSGGSGSAAGTAADKERENAKPGTGTKKVGSVPFVHKQVAVLTAEETQSLGLPVTKDEVLELYKRRDFIYKTPDYTLNQSRLNVEIAKRGKLRVACDLRQIGAKGLLLEAFHMPMLPGEEQASRIWLIKSDSTYNIIDMGELDVGVYQFLAIALDENYQLAASPNLQRMRLSYGYKEALDDYKDRQFMLYGDMSKPAAFGEIEPANAAKELPLFKIVPATCVLKPGEKIELTAVRLLSNEQRRLKRINSRYGTNYGSGDGKGGGQSKSGESQKTGKTKSKRFRWSMYGQGKLVPVSDNSAVYYAPNIDSTGAEISCWEEGDDSAVNAYIYVTTLPIGEIPSLEKTTFTK